MQRQQQTVVKPIAPGSSLSPPPPWDSLLPGLIETPSVFAGGFFFWMSIGCFRLTKILFQSCHITQQDRVAGAPSDSLEDPILGRLEGNVR